jgi:hypothetical protein
MLTLHFKSALHPDLKVGPHRAVRVGGNFIRDSDTGRMLARYQNHAWLVNEHAFTRYDCSDRMSVIFENREKILSEPIGPVTNCSTADGAMYVDNKLFARLHDDTQLWQHYATETYWPIMILESLRPAETR